MLIKSGVLYGVTDFIPLDKDKYVFDLEISHTSGSPTVQRALCDTVKEVITLLKDSLPEGYDYFDTSDDYVDNTFNVMVVWTTDHSKDYQLDIEITNLQTKDDFTKIKETVKEKFEQLDLKRRKIESSMEPSI